MFSFAEMILAKLDEVDPKFPAASTEVTPELSVTGAGSRDADKPATTADAFGMSRSQYIAAEADYLYGDLRGEE